MNKNAKRFEVGDFVTYKAEPHENGGDDQQGFKGKLKSYLSYSYTSDCWQILVGKKGGGNSYTMLESEFEEFEEDQPIKIKKKTIKLFE